MTLGGEIAIILCPLIDYKSNINPQFTLERRPTSQKLREKITLLSERAVTNWHFKLVGLAHTHTHPGASAINRELDKLRVLLWH